jgi:hypothetical protein
MAVNKGITNAAIKRIVKFGHKPWTQKEAEISPSLNSFLYRAKRYGLIEQIDNNPSTWHVLKSVKDFEAAYKEHTRRVKAKTAEDARAKIGTWDMRRKYKPREPKMKQYWLPAMEIKPGVWLVHCGDFFVRGYRVEIVKAPGVSNGD